MIAIIPRLPVGYFFSEVLTKNRDRRFFLIYLFYTWSLTGLTLVLKTGRSGLEGCLQSGKRLYNTYDYWPVHFNADSSPFDCAENLWIVFLLAKSAWHQHIQYDDVSSLNIRPLLSDSSLADTQHTDASALAHSDPIYHESDSCVLPRPSDLDLSWKI